MLDICLIQLPNPALAHTMYNSLGIMYLASVVEQAGYSVEIADLRHNGGLPRAHYYGFSCTTPEITYAKELAKQVRGKTIVGGAHPSLLPEDCWNDFDYIVIGEGEEVILDILSGKITSPKGIVASRIRDLDKIPYPARNKVKFPYSDMIFEGERYGHGAMTGTLIATRGCPFSCHYCANIFRYITSRSVENIIGEMKLMMADGVTHFKFMDDCFTLHHEFERLTQEMKKLNISYIAHTRADLMTPKIALSLKESGCYQSGLGVETADDTVLKLNNKKETVEDSVRAIRTLKEAGIHVKPYWMTGLPGETDKTIERNKEFMITTQPNKWTVSTFTPYPGSAIFKRPEDFGIEIVNKDWTKWWNYCENQYNHILIGQTKEEMWKRYNEFYGFLRSEVWKQEAH